MRRTALKPCFRLGGPTEGYGKSCALDWQSIAGAGNISRLGAGKVQWSVGYSMIVPGLCRAEGRAMGLPILYPYTRQQNCALRLVENCGVWECRDGNQLPLRNGREGV